MNKYRRIIYFLAFLFLTPFLAMYLYVDSAKEALAFVFVYGLSPIFVLITSVYMYAALFDPELKETNNA